MRASATSVTVPASASTVTVGSTCVSGSECASGISSSVRLAAWIAASRATVATSPFGASPAATRAAASGDIRTTARARAQRDGLVLGRDVDHARVAGGVEVGERSVHILTWYGALGSGREDHRPPVRRPARARRRRPRRARPARRRAGAATCWPRWACSRGSASSRSTASTPRPTSRVRAGSGGRADPAGERRRRRPGAARRDHRSAAGPGRGRRRRARSAGGRGRLLRGRHARGRGARLRGLRRDGARQAARDRGEEAARTGCARSRSSTAPAACR